ncbi:MAG: class I SAM-dependent methyltransferase [Cyanobacteria bacterium J06560_5]
MVATSLFNGLLSIKPLANFAKQRARTMMMDRAESIGVPWREEVKALETRDDGTQQGVNPVWEEELRAIANPNLNYPSYYANNTFHAYDDGNLGWLPAMEVDVAARSVHARVWPAEDERSGLQGDANLRASYHQALQKRLPTTPQSIVDLGCGVGISTLAMQEAFPAAQLTGVELSPYFLTVGEYRREKAGQTHNIQWVHAAAEHTGLPTDSADLVSAFLVFHELPLSAAHAIFTEAARLVKPGGHFAIMDMNPQSDAYKTMPPYVFTLLKSTEPFLDQYFELDMNQAFQAAGFAAPQTVINTPRHRIIIGKKRA